MKCLPLSDIVFSLNGPKKGYLSLVHVFLSSLTVDTTPPTISGCPNDIFQFVELGLPGALVTYTEPTASDLSPPVLLLPPSARPNDFFLVGATEVEYIFVDNAMNEATCRFVITILEGKLVV